MSREPIAIVGIGCRFPGGADHPQTFWKLLCDGVDAVREIPADRWSIDAYYDPVPGRTGKSITRFAGCVDGIDRFDPAFFGISPREAAFMDPQQRMLLETAWEALEDSGQVASHLRGSPTGVFIGISTHDYELLQSSPDERSEIDIYSTTGGVLSIAANRISYCFDLRGPSVAIDTACSSSLIAAHLACESLWSGGCALALVGGVNALLAPMPFVAFSRMSMLSPTGRCKAFDASADGFVRAEGAGVVVLKPLAAALADGDRIYAAIRGTAANQDGHTNGITVPSAAAQAALVRAACRQAEVPPSAIGYVEAHGTGTPVGDPIEASALGEALGAGRPDDRACIVGSVKTNIGHLEAGAGIAGLIKLALALYHGRIPPNLHFQNPNPAIDFERLKLRVPVAVEEMPRSGGDAPLAGINSFGFGGSNAHAILQAVPKPARRAAAAPEAERARLLVMSAQSGGALAAIAGRYRELLSSSAGDASLDEICWTAGARRTHHRERLAIVGRDRREIGKQVGAFAVGESLPGVVCGQPLAEGRRDVAFVFSGQGPQWWGMGRELFREEPVFRDKLEECDRELGRHASWRLLEELSRDERSSRLAETAIAQPAIFALQVALAALWESWGIRPAAVVGHSVGEVAAAHVAGVLTLGDAAHVIFQRGRCMDLAPERGRMLAAELSAEEAAEVIAPYEDRVAIGAVNAPASVTLSGDGAALEEIAAALESREVFCRSLRVNYAFHSPQMDPVREELLTSLGSFARAPAHLPMISTVTAGEVVGDELSAEYWWRNVRETVRFAPAIGALVHRGWRIFLELSAHPAVGASIAECLRHHSCKGAVLPSLRRTEAERATMLGSLALLYVNGVEPDWRGVYPQAERLATLPGYAWQRERFWHESEGSRQRRLDPALHPFLARDVGAAESTWEGWIDKEAMPYLKDHRVQGHIVFPAAGYVEVAAEAADKQLGAAPWRLEDVDFVRALVVPEGEDVPRLQISLEPQDSRFTISSSLGAEGGHWTAHCVGRLRPDSDAEPAERLTLARVRARCGQRVSPQECYRRFRDAGLEFGPAFRGIETLWRRDGEALGRVRAPEPITEGVGRYRVHPALLDACFQVLSAALPEEPAGGARLYLPVHIERLRFFSRPGPAVWSHARLVRRGGNAIVGDIRIVDDSGARLVEIEGFRCQALRAAISEDPESWLYESRWEAKPLPGAAAPVLPADFLRPASRAAGRAHEVLAQRQGRGGARARFLAIERELDRLCRGYVVAALRELGWKPRAGRSLRAESLGRSLGIASAHRPLLDRFLGFLADDGILSRSRDRWRVRRVPETTECELLWRTLLERFPAFHPELVLLRRTGSALAAVLRGESDPLAVIAPGGSLLALEQLYQDAPSFADYNHAVAAAVAEAVGEIPDGRTLRVLEIGAGTGGTTAHVLRRLPADAEYVFSDVSPMFFARAEQKFFEYPRLRCQLLDIERPPAEQGLEAHSFDVVIACDALHATARLSESLAHVRELVAPQGVFVALEIDRPPRWVDLVFGLTPGWWRFRDHDLRPRHPLLGRSSWCRLLVEAGFTEVNAVPDVRSGHRSGQTILVARAPRSKTAPRAPRPAPSPGGEARSWVLLADRSGTAEALAALLAACGDFVALVFAGSGYRELGDGRFEVDPRSAEQLRHLFADLQTPADAIVHLWSLDLPPPSETTLDTLIDAERRGCLAALHLVQALCADESAKVPRLWLVTRGSQKVGDEEVSPAQAPLWALGRVIQNEQRRLRCRMIDLDPRAGAGELGRLVAELRFEDVEEEVALRGEVRHVNRLARTSLDLLGACGSAARSYRWEIPSPGALDSLRPSAQPRRRPARGEVEIEVRAAALNFRDVMKALGIYPIENDDDLLIGDECAGRIVALGPGIDGLREGDAVLGMGSGCFASHLTLEAGRVARIPRGLSFEEAATIPVVFLTAWYALHHLGQIGRGEKVLVQAATGGVGLAALEIARLAGAEIFATAGSPEKRDFLRALGVAHGHVMDSRSLAFADQVLAATGGRGVDLVLNSLAGEAIAKGLSVLAPHGRFLEIGKRDIYQDTRIGLRPFRRSLSMFAVDLPQVMRDHPVLTRALIAEILGRFAARKLHPLPHRTFAVSDLAGAFRFMAKAQHVGKVVVSMDDDQVRPRAAGGAAVARFRKDASYLITGGLGGFGLALAQWMVENGARCLVLAGRSGASTPRARRAVSALRRRGVRVVVAESDAANAEQVARLFRRIATSLPPLRGIVHAAMVLDDGLLTQLDAERLHRVMAPKVHGAWNLHLQSRDLALDFFVLFSSVSSIVGAPAQGNYVAANGFLDALAHYRRRLGLPALAVNWGQLSEVGYVARHEKVKEHLTRQGILGISPDEALGLLGRLLRSRAGQVGVVRVDWHRWASFLPAVASAPRYAALIGASAAADGGKAGRGVRDTFLEAPAEQRLGLVTAYVREQVGRVLRTSVTKLDVGRSLSELGVDSLMAFELVNRIETQFALALPTSKLTAGTTIERLAAVLFEVLMAAPASSPGASAPVTATASQTPSARADLILAFRAEGNRLPLFCVHPAGGLANIYQHLAESLPADLPVHGLQSRAIAQGVAEQISLARLAADYATEIVERQPSGPYRLLGFSLGGILALAVTTVLEGRGERVELLGVVDSDLSLTLPGRRTGAYVTQHIVDMYRTFAREFAPLRRLEPATLEEHATDLASRVLAAPASARGATIVRWLTERGLLAPSVSPALLERYFSLFDAHVALVEGFHPPAVQAPIVLWHRGQASNGESDRIGPWRRCVGSLFEERSIEGSHYDLLYPPLVTRLAAELDEVLRRAEDHGGTGSAVTSIPGRGAPVAAAYLGASVRDRAPSARSTPARRGR